MAIEQLPQGCGYQGREFGAQYLDSECFGGRLYDMDNCDNEGNIYEPAEYIPCPKCNLKECLVQWRESSLEDGYFARVLKAPRRYPYKRRQLDYPKTYKKLRSAWLKGWDIAQAEAEKASLVSARHPA